MYFQSILVIFTCLEKHPFCLVLEIHWNEVTHFNVIYKVAIFSIAIFSFTS